MGMIDLRVLSSVRGDEALLPASLHGLCGLRLQSQILKDYLGEKSRKFYIEHRTARLLRRSAYASKLDISDDYGVAV